jgi:hypothetical protein
LGDLRICPKRSGRSAPWYPTGRPPGDRQLSTGRTTTSGEDDPKLTAHRVVIPNDLGKLPHATRIRTVGRPEMTLCRNCRITSVTRNWNQTDFRREPGTRCFSHRAERGG